MDKRVRGRWSESPKRVVAELSRVCRNVRDKNDERFTFMR